MPATRAICPCLRASSALSASAFAGVDETSWDLVDFDIFEKVSHADLWRRAVEWLLRLGKAKTQWWARGRALCFIADRRKALNAQIDRELRQNPRCQHHGKSHINK